MWKLTGKYQIDFLSTTIVNFTFGKKTPSFPNL